MDYRIKENRREAFIRWYAWSLKYNDCDPAVWLTNYLNKRFEHNSEQKIWFCWLYSNTYQLPTSWVLLNEFPDFELATYDRLNSWNTENYLKLRYQTDTKWNKGHLPVMFNSYKEFISDSTQKQAIESCYGQNEKENFKNLWEIVNSKFYKFGRYSTWFYLQHLKSTANIKIEPTSLMLNDYSGSRSHRNGLLLALGRDSECDTKLSKEQYDYLEHEASSILEEMLGRFPELKSDLDFFTMETCLCSFKKIFREKRGRYLGYYLDRQAEEICLAENDGWIGIDWNVLWQARSECLTSFLDKRTGIDKFKFSNFINTGKLQYLELMFSDEEVQLVGIDAFF